MESNKKTDELKPDIIKAAESYVSEMSFPLEFTKTDTITVYIDGANHGHSLLKSENNRLDQVADHKHELNVYLNMEVDRLTKINDELVKAAETVVNTYEGDGMENMDTRDHVMYKVVKKALENARK